MKFYLGTHRPYWLWEEPGPFPWFVSHRTLRRYKKLRASTGPWALDSGGFTELSMFGEWRTSPIEYVAAVRRYRDEIGNLEWAAPQDWMCEPWIVEKTGLSVRDHQRRTVNNFIFLRAYAPDVPFVPVLQGWDIGDYLRHRDMYANRGVDLSAERLVGVGSVCRRAHLRPMGVLFRRLHSDGLRMHGFGIKADGVAKYGWALTSSDSLAWSYAGRKRGRVCGTEHPAARCNNCRPWAEKWGRQVASKINYGERDADR